MLLILIAIVKAIIIDRILTVLFNFKDLASNYFFIIFFIFIATFLVSDAALASLASIAG